MELEESSAGFIRWHMAHSFKELMGTHIVLDIDWMEGYDSSQSITGAWTAVAMMGDMTGNNPNLSVMFPPFYPEGENEYSK